MKSFNNFLSERVTLRARKNMPQIDNMDKFIEDITKNDYKIKSEKVDPQTLKPTQNEFNKEKVKGMIQSGKYKNKPIVVTSDNYILDGHHRWKAHLVQKEQQPVIRVNMSFDKLFDFVEGKKYVKYKQIHESALAEWFGSNMSMADYMTDEEKEKFNKEKSDKIYNDYFTAEAFDKVYKSMKEDGEGTAMPTNAPNGVAGVALPAVHNLGNKDIKRRRKVSEWSADGDDFSADGE